MLFCVIWPSVLLRLQTHVWTWLFVFVCCSSSEPSIFCWEVVFVVSFLCCHCLCCFSSLLLSLFDVVLVGCMFLFSVVIIAAFCRFTIVFVVIHLAAQGPKLFGTCYFWSTNFGIDEGHYVEVSNKTPTFTMFCAKFHLWFLGHVETHRRVTPLPTW